MAKRLKKISKEQFEDIQKCNWRPVKLEWDAIPDFLENLPEENLHSVVASGTLLPGLSYFDHVIPSGELIGGIDVYRNAPDDPVEFNKDWYAVVYIPCFDGIFMVSGPFKDSEHWIDEIPRRLHGAEVLGVPKKPER